MSKRILIIDDEKIILQSLSNLFIKQDWSVDICQDGQNGLEKIQKNSYDCILSDIRMPGMQGPEILLKIREMESLGKISKQNVIFMTGYADEDAHVQAFQLGAFTYIKKPFDIQDVLDKANACIRPLEVLHAFESVADGDEEKELKKIRKQYDRPSVDRKADLLSHKFKLPLKHIKGCTYDTQHLQGNIENPIGIVQIPLGIIGPIEINGRHAQGEFMVPMATTEGALLLTYDLGSRLLNMTSPIETEVLSKVVHVTPVFPIKSDEDARVGQFVNQEYDNIKKVAEGQSRHTTLLGIEQIKVQDNFLLKFKYDTADAQGLNMINQASFNACKYIQNKTGANFYHRSHYSGVKHHSALNEREGYGRVVKAKGILSSKALAMMRVSAQQMKDFCDRCIACGTAAGISSVNVHASNAIAAIFLACGQDMADISSAHVCQSKCEIIDQKDMYWEVTLKNLLIASVGGGTSLGTQRECLQMIDCFGAGKSDKLAEIIAAVTLAGEIPTAAAVVSETYVDIHNKYGRNKTPKIF